MAGFWGSGLGVGREERVPMTSLSLERCLKSNHGSKSVAYILLETAFQAALCSAFSGDLSTFLLETVLLLF